MKPKVYTPPYEGWAPYCLKCRTMMRMEPKPYGWQCRHCKNKINRALTHYNEGDLIMEQVLIVKDEHETIIGVVKVEGNSLSTPELNKLNKAVKEAGCKVVTEEFVQVSNLTEAERVITDMVTEY